LHFLNFNVTIQSFTNNLRLQIDLESYMTSFAENPVSVPLPAARHRGPAPDYYKSCPFYQLYAEGWVGANALCYEF